MIKEPLKTVKKVWGEELWIVNNDLYCGKLLFLDKGAKSSYHCHPIKTETFKALEGAAILIVEGNTEILNPQTKPKTIEPGEFHSIEGLRRTIILEVSTPHSDDDVIRQTESIPGRKHVEYLTRKSQ